MQPDQNAPNGGNPYEFIVNPTKPQKKSLLGGSGFSKNQRIIFVVLGLAIIGVCIMLVSSLLSSGSSSNKQQLVGVIKQQRELIRISEIGAEKAKTAEARNLALTTKLALSSEQKDLEAAAKTLGVKINNKTLASKNPKNDEILTKAEQANNFDKVFVDKLRADLVAYAKDVQTAYNNNSGTKTKAALEAQFNNAATLANFKE